MSRTAADPFVIQKVQNESQISYAVHRSISMGNHRSHLGGLLETGVKGTRHPDDGSSAVQSVGSVCTVGARAGGARFEFPLYLQVMCPTPYLRMQLASVGRGYLVIPRLWSPVAATLRQQPRLSTLSLDQVHAKSRLPLYFVLLAAVGKAQLRYSPRSSLFR
jgi:hypothetical protein